MSEQKTRSGSIVLVNDYGMPAPVVPKSEASDAQLVQVLQRQAARVSWMAQNLAQKLDDIREALGHYHMGDRSPETLETFFASLEGALGESLDLFSSKEAPPQ